MPSYCPCPHLSGAAEFEDRRRQLNCSGLRVGSILSATLVPMFGVLDWFVMPEHLAFVLTLRAIATAYAVLCFVLTYTRFGVRWSSPLSVSLFTLVGEAISVMIYLDDGYRSPYYAGLMLVVLAAGVVFRWTLVEGGVCCTLIYLAYFVPGLSQYLALRQNLETFLANNFFLVSTIVIVFVAQYFNLQQLWREYRANSDLVIMKASVEAACTELKALDQLKTKFFNNVTHELRTPLTLILATLDSGNVGAQTTSLGTDQLQTIRANAQRLLRLITDLLDLGRLEEHFLRLNLKETSLAPLLAEIVEYARPLAARKDIALRLEVDANAGSVCVDAEKIERVVVNLLANALKFTEPGGEVLVWMRSSRDYLLVGVRDNGRGICRDAQCRIFERFRQADDDVARRYGGTGIGLALAKELVELHGGHISVESEEGVGSSFVVHLRLGRDHFAPGTVEKNAPSAQNAHCSTSGAPQEWSSHLAERRCYRFISLSDATERLPVPPESKPGHATSRVLVVEDNVEVQRHLSLQLSDCYSVMLATDGERGLEVARSERPDVIITDCMMPRMDGVTLLKELKSSPSTADIPVVMLSANNLESNRTAARDAGADIYLSKPFSAQELRSAVNQLLRRRVRQVGVVVREQVKSLEVISAGFAHEIHNPLSYLSNAVHVIQQKLDEVHGVALRPELSLDELRASVLSTHERTSRMITVALTGIKRIQAVVTLVRGYARAGSPRDVVALSLDELVHEVSRLVMTPDGRDVQIIPDLATGGIRVRGVPGELEQVIRNLLQNALEAVGNGGHVWLRTHCDGQWVILEVTDDGPGMPQDVLSRIFTPFFTTKEPGRGMGLGLAISHQLVTNVGGDISVESRVDYGTTFRVHLPIYQEQALEPSAHAH